MAGGFSDSESSSVVVAKHISGISGLVRIPPPPFRTGLSMLVLHLVWQQDRTGNVSGSVLSNRFLTHNMLRGFTGAVRLPLNMHVHTQISHFSSLHPLARSFTENHCVVKLVLFLSYDADAGIGAQIQTSTTTPHQLWMENDCLIITVCI